MGGRHSIEVASQVRFLCELVKNEPNLYPRTCRSKLFGVSELGKDNYKKSNPGQVSLAPSSCQALSMGPGLSFGCGCLSPTFEPGFRARVSFIPSLVFFSYHVGQFEQQNYFWVHSYFYISLNTYAPPVKQYWLISTVLAYSILFCRTSLQLASTRWV